VQEEEISRNSGRIGEFGTTEVLTHSVE